MVKALFLDSKIIAFKYVDRRLINKEGQYFAVKCRFFRQKSLSVITFFYIFVSHKQAYEQIRKRIRTDTTSNR